jgi:hypothetical protein
MALHRNEYKRGQADCSSAKVVCFSSSYIELLEEVPCANKQQLNRREGEIVRQTPNAVNRRVEGRTREEYYNDNRLSILEALKTPEKRAIHAERMKEHRLRKKLQSQKNSEVNVETECPISSATPPL